MASAVSGCWPSSVQRTLLKWQTHAEYTTSHTRLNSLIVAKQGQTEDHKHMITYNSSTTTITLSTCTHTAFRVRTSEGWIKLGRCYAPSRVLFYTCFAKVTSEMPYACDMAGTQTTFLPRVRVGESSYAVGHALVPSQGVE